MATSTRTVPTPKNYETIAWKWMRHSGVLLIPLVWIHVLIQDVLVGVHAIDLDYVVRRWSLVGWQVYDIALLAFAFAHGMNGLRQVANDFIHEPKAQKATSWVIFGLWLAISIIGAIAIFAAAAKHMANL